MWVPDDRNHKGYDLQCMHSSMKLRGYYSLHQIFTLLQFIMSFLVYVSPTLSAHPMLAQAANVDNSVQDTITATVKENLAHYG